MQNTVIAALYQFASLPDYKEMREKLWNLCSSLDIKGTLLLAEEGINGTVCGSRDGIDQLKSFLDADGRFDNLEYKESFSDRPRFFRLKVRLKKEIVTLGVEGVSPTKKVGQYVEPQDWNSLISDPEVVVIDTRNDYEYNIGTFKGAINPNTDSFREFPAFAKQFLNPEKHKHVAMFCTGGIRCEKSTAYMLEEGFENVYHLKGGILKYLEEVPESESLWEGECYVFDQRVAVAHGLKQGTYTSCHACRAPVSEQERLSDEYEEGVSCPHCFNQLPESTKLRAQARQKQVTLAQKRGQAHMGSDVAKQLKSSS